MQGSHQARVEQFLREAADERAALLSRLPQNLQDSLPVDAQGLTRAIDYLASAAGLSESERRELIRPHALNPAVLHARIFGAEPLPRETVIGAFVEGARVRADGLTALADRIGGGTLGREVRALLVADPPPGGAASETSTEGVLPALRATYAAQERAALVIAGALDDGQ